MTTNIKKQAFSELDTGLRSELSGRLLHTARWLRGPLFCFDPFCSVWLFQRPWSGNARWKHQGKKYQEIHINPLALEDAALCVFDVLKEVQMQLTPGGPGHVSRSRPFWVECVASEFTCKCRYGHSPFSLFQPVVWNPSKMVGISIFLDGKILPFPTVALF